MALDVVYADGFGGYSQSASGEAFAELGTRWSRNNSNTGVQSAALNGPAHLRVAGNDSPRASYTRDLGDRVCVGFAVWPQDVSGSTRPWFWLRTAGGGTKVLLTSVGTSQTRLTVGSTAVVTVDVHPPQSATTYVELEYRSDASGGFVRVWFDNVLVIEYTGDTVGAAGDVGIVAWASMGGDPLASFALRVGALYIGTFEGAPSPGTIRLRPQVVHQGLPDSDVSTDWDPDTGSDHWSRVNQQPHNGDSAYVESDTEGDVDRYGVSGLGGVIGTVAAVVQKTISKAPDGGDPHIQHAIWVDGQRHDGATDVLGTAYRSQLTLWTQDPESVAPWIPEDLLGVHVGQVHAGAGS
jgi:hypothetical protein